MDVVQSNKSPQLMMDRYEYHKTYINVKRAPSLTHLNDILLTFSTIITQMR